MLLCIFSTGIFSTCIYGQQVWTKHESPVLENGPVGSWDADGPGFPSVLMIDDTYHMWYGGMGNNVLAIGHASSEDGITWTKDENNPVLNVGEAGSWDAARAYLPTVVHDGSTFHMWYVGANTSGDEKLGYATSDNGVDWTKQEGKLTYKLDGEPYTEKVGSGAVYFDGELFHMWFSQHGSNPVLYEMGYATSVNGADWDLYENNPVLKCGEYGKWDRPRLQASSVIKLGDDYHLCYSGGDFYGWRLGFATSRDGINWAKSLQNPMVDVGPDGSWDDLFVSFASLLYDADSNRFKMWYLGGNVQFGGAIGYAEMALIPPPEPWHKKGEPVLEKGPEGSWDAGGTSFPSVLMINSTYHMWYAAMENDVFAIGHASSEDGINWTKDENNPVLQAGEPGSWDDRWVYVPKVVYDGSSFHMWYNGSRANGSEQIGYATSPDGSAWTRHEGNPVLASGEAGAWDSGNVGPGGVYYDGESFHMWYAGNAANAPGVFKVGYASSADGSTWTRSNVNPIMESESGTWESGRVTASSVLFDGLQYHMWYDGGEFAKWRIGYASSPDGLNWTRSENNPVLEQGASGSWDSQFVSFASVLYDPNSEKYKMWYFGGDASVSGAIGYAGLINSSRTITTLPDHILSIFPNPSSDLITLRSDVQDVKTIEIISLNGQLMYRGIMEGYEMQADLSGLSKGLYLLRLKSNTTMKTIKLVKL